MPVEFIGVTRSIFTFELSRVVSDLKLLAKSVKPSDITSHLRCAVRFLGFGLGFTAHEVSARSLRAGGAMALLVSKVDTDIIQLLGRWRSDEMLRYLHLTAEPIMRTFAQKMLNADYTISPNQLVPMH